MKQCKTCGLEFNDKTKHLFVREYHILKDKKKHYHYRYSRCKKCQTKRGSEFIKSNRLKVRKLKETTPCKDCGIQYPYYVMQFDHLKDKEFTIGLKNTLSYTKLLKEINKCDILCANCHAIRTHKRRQNEDK